MDQVLFDPGDNSAAAAIAIANGNYTGAGATPGMTGGGGSGVAFGDRFNVREL